MGIIARFKDIMASNINALLDKVEDPEKMVEQLLRNLSEDLAEVKKETASVIAEETRAKRELDACKSEIAELLSYATKALQASNEDDARAFLTEKSTKESVLVNLQSTYDIAHQNATSLRQMHDKLVKDINELNARKQAVKGKMAVAKTQKRINKIVGSSVDSANDSISAFSRLEAKANKALDEANAMAELNASTAGDIKDLKAKYQSGSAGVDSELAALKASLGM